MFSSSVTVALLPNACSCIFITFFIDTGGSEQLLTWVHAHLFQVRDNNIDTTTNENSSTIRNGQDVFIMSLACDNSCSQRKSTCNLVKIYNPKHS